MSRSDEVKTIKKRNVCLELSDTEVERISEKAGIAGLSVSALLQQFIGDLVCGTHTSGSDERMYASQWFERCCFGMFPEKTFIRYLLEEGEMESFLKDLERVEDLKRDIKKAEKEIRTGIMEGRIRDYTWKDITDGDGKPFYKSYEEWECSKKEEMEQDMDDLEINEQVIKKIWEKFLSWTDEKDLSLVVEIQKVIDWEKSISSFKGEE